MQLPEGLSVSATTVDGEKVFVHLDETLISQIVSIARKNSRADKRFDLNFIEGIHNEGLVSNLLKDSQVEVKTDVSVSRTSNIAIETTCSGKPSGINATTANWWSYVLEGDQYNGEVVVLIKTSRLRRILSTLRELRGGDNNIATMKLLPVFRLLMGLEGKSE